jgi:methylated-DNA-protein-cysteine methyltransferase related protein
VDPFDRSTWTDFERAAARVLDALDPGDLVTYGEVAAEAGYPGAARAVGSLLRRGSGAGFPWWRVISSSGKLLVDHEAEQTRRLRAEGVGVHDGRVGPTRQPGR